MDYANRVCDLECVKKAPPRHEFVGPVKIILIEPSAVEYKRKAWGSAVLTLVMLLMGATVFTIFFFTLSFKLALASNIHVFLCTMGFQLFLPSGILMLNSFFGGAAHLKTDDRKFQHFFLQVSAVICGVFGAIIVFVFGNMKKKLTLHSVAGLLASLLAILTSVIGPTVYFTNPAKAFGKFNKGAHIAFAVPTFLLSTICFILGLTKESFIKWAPIKDLHNILIAFTLLYSAAILISVYIRGKYPPQYPPQ